jgi:hypothetical protein
MTNPTPVRLVKVEPNQLAAAPPREVELGWVAMTVLPPLQGFCKVQGLVQPLMVIGMSWVTTPVPFDLTQLLLATVDLHLADPRDVPALQAHVRSGLVAAPAQAMGQLPPLKQN